ncbi:MAG: hypothetical protein EOP32_31375 [Rhodococcus sp. (in: high G+C Gram-positive bacteria)]|nr:MAG: hypothetical protein EOP32_31375 [Rhodococcus sp. (in: high G+C Gram-positive bacteria)]
MPNTLAGAPGRGRGGDIAWLDEEPAAELLTALLVATPATELVRGLTSELGGNPLAPSEVADALTPAQLAGEQRLRLPLPAGSTADRIFGHRVAALDREPRQALRITAVAAGDGLHVALAVLATQQIGRAPLELLARRMTCSGVGWLTKTGFIHQLYERNNREKFR